jgi:hypothetical protein
VRQKKGLLFSALTQQKMIPGGTPKKAVDKEKGEE